MCLCGNATGSLQRYIRGESGKSLMAWEEKLGWEASGGEGGDSSVRSDHDGLLSVMPSGESEERRGTARKAVPTTVVPSLTHSEGR